ncbi:MAG: FAD-binding protein, partial [Polyangia bacterium]
MPAVALPALPIADAVPLAPLTTLELGGPARHLVEAQSPATVAAAVTWAAARGLPLLVLGGGSNVVISDSGFAGLVVRMTMRGLRFNLEGGQGVVQAAAGEPWDALVSNVVGRGWAG